MSSAPGNPAGLQGTRTYHVCPWHPRVVALEMYLFVTITAGITAENSFSISQTLCRLKREGCLKNISDQSQKQIRKGTF